MCEPQIFLRNGFLKDVVEAHDMGEINEHCVRFSLAHGFYLRSIIGLSRIRIQLKAAITETNN